MDDVRIADWTRRRFAHAAGGLVAAVLGLAGLEEAKAGKKRKKRCKKLGASCTSGGKRTCCGNLRCKREMGDPARKVCCKSEGNPCSPLASEPECCGSLSCCGPIGDEVCSLVCFSDRALKANFASVDPADMMSRVRDLPISTWNYTSDHPSVRHIGPMAQDFAALFAVGSDDRHIHPLDGQGVALAAIQGLLGQVQDLRAANAELAGRIATLEREPPDASPPRRIPSHVMGPRLP